MQHEMTPVCPACRNNRTAPARSGHSVHRISFAMNGGQRKENYLVLLTDEQAVALLGLPNNEAYNRFWSLWDKVVVAEIDAGTDYEGMGCEVLENQEYATRHFHSP
jgi:hypothetical protein